MASSVSILFCFSFLFPFFSLVSSDASLIQTICKKTSSNEFCLEKLQADPESAQAGDVNALASISVKIALASVNSAAECAGKLAKDESIGASDRAPLLTCAEKYAEAGKALATAMQALIEKKYDYASVHVGAAQAYGGTCVQSFVRASPAVAYPQEMASKDDEAQRLCTVASEIIYQLS